MKNTIIALILGVTSICEAQKIYVPNTLQYDYIVLTNAYYAYYGDGTLFTNDFSPTYVDWSNVVNRPTFTSGTNGLNGSNGTNGLNGSQGIQGVVGPQGNTGSTGSNGAVGAQGIQGTNAFSINVTNRPAHISGIWYSNDQSYTLMGVAKVIMTPALVAGNIEVDSWTAPNVNDVVNRRTNDWVSCPTFLLNLSPPAKGSVSYQVPPHWCFTITNAAISGVGNSAVVAPNDSVYWYQY